MAKFALQSPQGKRSGGDTCNVYPLHFRNTYIHPVRNRPVLDWGAQDLLIIGTLDILLVACASNVDAVQRVVAKRFALDAAQVVQHHRVARRWG